MRSGRTLIPNFIEIRISKLKLMVYFLNFLVFHCFNFFRFSDFSNFPISEIGFLMAYENLPDVYQLLRLSGLAAHLKAADLNIKLGISRKLMRVLFAKSDAPTQFAKQVGWQECICG